MFVEVVPYDPGWPAAFEALHAELGAALSGVPVVAIEHVGSTSIPGLAAKPVIDIDIVVEREDVDRVVAALTAVGYSYLGDLGIPDRHAFRALPVGPRRNVYVAVQGCLALRNHLAVRELLRADDALRDEYGALKMTLSKNDYPDIDAYVADKSDLLQRVLGRAGFEQSQLRSIEEMNPPQQQ
jgi:GrpB-like predicted nucleotidyltransferase (UPF0157 family)